ncbi:MAG: hydrogenase maturation protease [Chloroflexota bacterium]
MLVVIGLGQSLRADDGVGPKVVEAWAAMYPETAQAPRLDVKLCALPGLALLDFLSGFEMAILVDAVLGGPCIVPGSLLLFNPADLESFSSAAGSAHGWGVAETLKLAETLGRDDIPNQIRVLGIAAAQVDLGLEMSPEVQAAVPAAVEKLQELVAEMIGE